MLVVYMCNFISSIDRQIRWGRVAGRSNMTALVVILYGFIHCYNVHYDDEMCINLSSCSMYEMVLYLSTHRQSSTSK